MGLLPPKLRDKGDLWSWCKRLGDYLTSTVLRAGRGIRVQQTDGGTTVSLGVHGPDHAAGGFDPIEFEKLIIFKAGDPDKTISLNPDDENFIALRVFAVKNDGTGSAWRTLFDLLSAVTGFEAGKILAINEDEDDFEFVEPGGELPTNLVTEKSANPFQENKLVLGSSTAKELWGTSIGIHPHGSDYGGFGNLGIPTDARSAAIADARFFANYPWNAATAWGLSGQVAVFTGTHSIGSDSLINLLNALFGISSPPVFIISGASGVGTASLNSMVSGFTGYAAGKALVVNSGANGLEFVTVGGLPASPQAGDLVYFNGSAWVRLAKPAADKYLKNTSAGALSWEDAGGLPATTGKSNRMVLQLDASLNPVWDWVRAH